MKKTHRDIKKKVESFIDLTRKDEHHRYRSWDHCYLFFQSLFRKTERSNRRLEKDKLDLACLNLAFYLASWGMYRGSTFVLQKDYKIFEEVVSKLFQPRFDDLWKVKYYDKLLESEDIIRENRREIENVFELFEELKKSFHNIRYLKDKKWNSAKASDTLITKILLGTMGCVPAYDNFFKNGLKKKHVKPYSSFSKDSFIKVLKFCRCNHEYLRNIPIQHSDCKGTKNYYPIMKTVDMYFWEIGYEDYLRGKKDKDQSKE